MTVDYPDLEALFVENPELTLPSARRRFGEPPACSGKVAIR